MEGEKRGNMLLAKSNFSYNFFSFLYYGTCTFDCRIVSSFSSRDVAGVKDREVYGKAWFINVEPSAMQEGKENVQEKQPFSCIPGTTATIYMQNVSRSL